MTKVGVGFLTLFAVGAYLIITQMIILDRQNESKRKYAPHEKLPEKQAGNDTPKMYLVKE